MTWYLTLCCYFLFASVFAVLKPTYQGIFLFGFWVFGLFVGLFCCFLGFFPFWKGKKLCKESLYEVNVAKQRSYSLCLGPASSVLIGTEWERIWMLKYKKKN